MSFQYDAGGNMTQVQDVSRGSTWSLSYDEANRVMSIYEPGMTAFRYRYRYNADGRRYHKQAVPYKSAPGPAQYYALDGSATVGFFPMSGTSYWTISTPSGEAIGRMTTSGSASYYIKDYLGSVRVVVNSSGTVLETRDYYPFGLEMPGRSYLSGTKAKENYTGHERDAETGMLYAGARYYMPNIGRWTSVDPLAASYPAWSPYNYVLNNPVGLVDPDGKAPACPSCDIRQNQRIYERTGVRQASPNAALARAAGEIAVGFTPLGVALDVREMGAAVRNRDAVGGALAGIGFLGGVGDVLKGIGKGVRGVLRGANRSPATATLDQLLESATDLKPLGNGTQGHVEGDAVQAFSKLTKGAEKLNSGAYRLDDGRIVHLHTSKKSGERTISVNTGEDYYKIRFKGAGGK